MPAQARRASLEKWLQDVISKVLRMPAGRIDAHTPLNTLGVDSLMAVEIRNRVEQGTRLQLPATLIFSHPDVATLATQLAGKMSLPIDDARHPEAVLVSATEQIQQSAKEELELLEELDQLSDEELLALMNEEEIADDE